MEVAAPFFQDWGDTFAQAAQSVTRSRERFLKVSCGPAPALRVGELARNHFGSLPIRAQIADSLPSGDAKTQFEVRASGATVFLADKALLADGPVLLF